MKHLIDDAVLSAFTAILICVTIFGGIKVILTEGEDRSFKRTMVVFFIAVPVGLLSGMVAFEWGAGQFTSCGIASVATLLSEQIVITIVTSKIDFSGYIHKAIENLIEKFTK